MSLCKQQQINEQHHHSSKNNNNDDEIRDNNTDKRHNRNINKNKKTTIAEFIFYSNKYITTEEKVNTRTTQHQHYSFIIRQNYPRRQLNCRK